MNLSRSALVPILAALFFAVEPPGWALGEPAERTPTAREVAKMVRARFLFADSLPPHSGERLPDWVERSQGALELGQATEAPGLPILTALLPGNIAYWRCATFTPELDWAGFSAEWSRWQQQGIAGLIVDLRGNQARNDFEGAARLAADLGPDRSPLFSTRPISGPGRDYAFFGSASGFTRPIALLVDGATAGAAEVLARALQRRGAILFGQATRGQAALWAELPLPGGRVLHYVTGTAGLGEKESFWAQPVPVDVAIPVAPATAAAVLATIDQHGVLDVIREAPMRRRLNEAALVAGDDPEVERRLIEQNRSIALPDVSPLDVVLVAARDGIQAIRLRPALRRRRSGHPRRKELLARSILG